MGIFTKKVKKSYTEIFKDGFNKGDWSREKKVINYKTTGSAIAGVIMAGAEIACNITQQGVNAQFEYAEDKLNIEDED